MKKFDIGERWRQSAVEGIRMAANYSTPIYAWIPMSGLNKLEATFIENPPVAYLNQMKAKRVAGNALKRSQRAKDGIDPKSHKKIVATTLITVEIR